MQMSAERESPWDMAPANESQRRYLANLVERLGDADWAKLDTTIASSCIDKLNSVRTAVGLPFVPFN